MKWNFFILLYSIIGINCASTSNPKLPPDSLDAKDLVPYGRTRYSNENGLELISSAVHFGFSFEGRRCEIYTSLPSWLNHNYLQYELDGDYQGRIRISKDASQPITIKAPRGGKHVIWIYKATEATTGPIYIKNITGEKVKSIQTSSAPLIEFIGNSITCGAAADTSEVPCGTGQYFDQHNAYYAYGPRVARQLGLNYTLSSVSGIGIYRTWNKESPSMPQVFEKLDFLENGKRIWEFSNFRPQVVSIALGTNDLSNGDGKTERLPFDSAKFVNNYTSFVSLVKSKYPRAQILLLSSPMMDGNRRNVLENCLMAVKKIIDGTFSSGKRVEVYFFKPMQARGCTGHPSVEDHAVLAEELVPVVRKLLQ